MAWMYSVILQKCRLTMKRRKLKSWISGQLGAGVPGFNGKEAEGYITNFKYELSPTRKCAFDLGELLLYNIINNNQYKETKRATTATISRTLAYILSLQEFHCQQRGLKGEAVWDLDGVRISESSRLTHLRTWWLIWAQLHLYLLRLLLLLLKPCTLVRRFFVLQICVILTSL